MKAAKSLLLCISLLFISQAIHAADQGPQIKNWWAKGVPGSGWVPADENPDFDKYIAMSAPMRKGKNGEFVVDEVAAKGWDKTLRSFYMTLEVRQENPIRVSIPEIPSTLPANAIAAKNKAQFPNLHSDCKILDVVDGKVLEATGKVGLAVSMETLGYIVGLPGSRLDITGFTDKSLPLAGRWWRARSSQQAYILITIDEILLVNVEEVEAPER